MKAILVIDMPKSCEECILCRDGYLCKILGDVDESVENGTKDLRCPLKPLPQKKEIDENHKMAKWDDDCNIAYNCGYNTCLEDILGEEE